jgi:hypothetical protein
MQTTRKAVRYYIDRDADTPVIRSVPVSCALTDAPAASSAATPQSDTTSTRTRGARERLSSIVQGSVRRPRRRDS